MRAAPFLLLPLLAFSSAQVTKETIPGATNVTRVDATIACAGATAPEAMPALKAEGFTSVINLRQEHEPGADVPAAREAAAANGLKYIHIPVDGRNPQPEAAERFLAAVTNPENHPVFIHCGTANRVGAMWLIKRVLADGWEIDRAVKEAEAIGLTNEGLKKFALEYIDARRR